MRKYKGLLVEQKFNNENLCEKLLKTKNVKIVEGNNWGDDFWGCVYDALTRSWIGEKHLCKILMEIRDKNKKYEKITNRKYIF